MLTHVDYEDENPSTISPKFPKPEKPVTLKNVSSKIKVKLANTTVYDGRYLVYRIDDISQVRLVLTEHLEFRVSEQLIDQDLFNASDKPYDWNEEINAVFPSNDQVRLAVYRNGLIKKEDVQDRQLLQMSLYGAFPTRFKGDN